MRECNQCHNGIPDDVAECPNCYNLTLRQILLQELFGLVLIAAVLIAGYFFCAQDGIAPSSKVLVSLLFGVPLILWGLFTLKKSIKQTLAAPYMKRYKNHTDHIFTDSCFCAFCGKFEGHDFEGCKCQRCRKTRNEGHSWDGCVCKRCGEIQHQLSGCTCVVCGETQHQLNNACICERCHQEFHNYQYSHQGSGECLCSVSGSAVYEEVSIYICTRCGKVKTPN